MPLPPQDINASITPGEFEVLIRDYLSNLGQELITFKAVHDIDLQRVDGNYQIDVYAEFEFLGADFKVLVECKRHRNKIQRTVVQLLFDKLRATGSHKGMIFATSGFQKGAVTYAKEHGIALVRVIEGRYTYFTKSSDSPNFDPPPWADIPKFVGEFKLNNTISFLQIGHLDSLSDYLFEVV